MPTLESLPDVQCDLSDNTGAYEELTLRKRPAILVSISHLQHNLMIEYNLDKTRLDLNHGQNIQDRLSFLHSGF